MGTAVGGISVAEGMVGATVGETTSAVGSDTVVGVSDFDTVGSGVAATTVGATVGAVVGLAAGSPVGVGVEPVPLSTGVIAMSFNASNL